MIPNAPYATEPIQTVIVTYSPSQSIQLLGPARPILRPTTVFPIRSLRDDMISEVTQLSGLGDGWFGLESHGIPDVTASRIRDLAQLLVNVKNLPDPTITPNINGTISLEWESARGEAYLEYGTSLISGFMRIEDGPTQYIDKITSLPDTFFETLRDKLFPITASYSITMEDLGRYGYESSQCMAMA